MSPINLELSPPQRLAVAYARADLRPALALLLAFDARLADIIGRASEPMIAQMKFAWWYDAMAREPEAKPKGEPILQALGELAMPALEGAMTRLLDAWSILLAADEWGADVIAEFAKTRSTAVFGTYANWVECPDEATEIGHAWAMADLRQKFGDRASAVADRLTSVRVSKRKLRPLSILALAATNPSGFRMIWHALTGR